MDTPYDNCNFSKTTLLNKKNWKIGTLEVFFIEKFASWEDSQKRLTGRLLFKNLPGI
jgi:hypothetical protein